MYIATKCSLTISFLVGEHFTVIQEIGYIDK